MRELYRERASLEREYASKLQALAKKYSEKDKKKMSALVVGMEPTKTWGEDIIDQSTLDNAFTQSITSMNDIAQDHINLADSLTSQVVEILRTSGQKYEDRKKKLAQHFEKLLSERDRLYSNRLKCKQKYDEACTELDSSSAKQERYNDDRHAERAARQYQQHVSNMFIQKNNYIIATAIANKAKVKFYDEDLPALEDHFQTLQTHLLLMLMQVMLEAHGLYDRHYDTVKNRVVIAEGVIKTMDPATDQDIFIDHNIRPFNLPSDWNFEPCSTHHDTGEMSVEDDAKVYLQNRLSKCRAKLEELEPVLQSKERDVERLATLVSAYSADHSLGDAESVTDDYLEMQQQLTLYLTSKATIQAEIETISVALNGDEGQQSPHDFKSSSFSIPTTCVYCKSSIWGLSKQGRTCKACGISVHARCELKVPAECSGSAGTTHSHRTSNSISAPSVASSASSLKSAGAPTAADMTPTPSIFAQSVADAEDEMSSARVMFDFSPTSPFELTVSEGAIVQILEEDDGSGWVKVLDNAGNNGLVPSSYLELSDTSSSISAPNVTEDPGPSERQKVRALYDYKAQGTNEIDIQNGELIALTAGPAGGRSYAEGWWEGVNSVGARGIFPSNYVEDAQ